MEYAGKLRDSCISFASNHVASCGHQVKRQPIDESAWSVMRPGDPLEIKVKEVEECLNQGLNGGVTFSPAAVLFVTGMEVLMSTITISGCRGLCCSNIEDSYIVNDEDKHHNDRSCAYLWCGRLG